MLQEKFILPNGTEIAGSPFHVVIATHNVVELLPDLPEGARAEVGRYYQPRGLHHVTAGGPLLLPVVDSAHAEDVLPIASWLSRNLGLDYAIVHDDPNKYPIGSSTPTVQIPYFVTPEYAHQNYWGPETSHVALLKNKRHFFEHLLEIETDLSRISQENGWGTNIILPFEIAHGRQETLQGIRTREEQIAIMYQDVSQRALEIGLTQEALMVQQYWPAVIFRQTTGDGGFGTGSLEASPDGYTVTTDDGVHHFANQGEAYGFLESILTNGEYIITRRVQTASSPSVGVYFADGKFAAMPTTIQFINGVGCVGGGSKNTLPEYNRELIDQIDPGLREISLYITKHYTHGGKRHGHIGFDFIVGGQDEHAFSQIIAHDEDLYKKYGDEPITVGIVESNPRFTSLSLTVQPFVRYELKRRVQSNGHISTGDLLRWYGEPDETDQSGGFAVWDYAYLPFGITSSESLISHIDQFNKRFIEYGIVMIPRIPAHKKDGKYVTSVGIGLIPTDDQEAHRMFQHIVSEMSRSCELAHLDL